MSNVQNYMVSARSNWLTRTLFNSLLTMSLFFVMGVSAAFAGNITITNTDPASTVGTNMTSFTVTATVQTAADFTNGETFTVTMPNNFPTVVVGAVDDGAFDVTVAIGGHAGAACGGDDGVTCSVSGREFTVTIADVADMDGSVNALTDGDAIVLTFATAADAAGTAAATYDTNFSIGAGDVGGTHAATEVVSGVTEMVITAADANASLVMADATAGGVGTATLTLTSTVALANTDTVVITFPAGIDVSGVASAVTGTWEAGGGAITCAAASQVVTCTTDGVITAATGTLIMTGISGGFVSTTDITSVVINNVATGSGGDINSDTSVALTDITVGDLTSTNVEPASFVAATVNANVVTFTTTAVIPNNGRIVITYPSGYDVSLLSGATAASLSGLDGTWTASVSGQVVTLQQASGTLSAAGAKSLTLGQVRNPVATGTTGTYTILTENTTAGFEDVETDAAVTADVIVSASDSGGTMGLVTALAVTDGTDGDVVITWTDPAGDDSTHISLLRGVAPIPVSGTAHGTILKGVQTFTDTDLSAGDVVTYSARSTDGARVGDLSAEVEFVVGSTLVEEIPALAVDMTAEDFSFTPALIEALPGQEVTVTFTEVTGTHDFSIDELTLNETIVTGTTVTFTAPETEGDYEFYCSIGEHRALGMIGTLTVAAAVVEETTEEETTEEETTEEEAGDDTTVDSEEGTATDEEVEEEEETEVVSRFSDIADHWAKVDIEAAVSNGWVKGDDTEDDLADFRPDDGLNRAEAAAFLYRVLTGEDDPATPDEDPFTDVDMGAWYGGYVAYLMDEGFVSGNPDGSYDPGAGMNRAEFVQLAMNVYKGSNTVEDVDITTDFADLDESAWFAQTVSQAVDLGFINGKDCDKGKCFDPSGGVTRAEASAILNRMFGEMEMEEAEEEEEEEMEAEEEAEDTDIGDDTSQEEGEDLDTDADTTDDTTTDTTETSE